MIEKNIIELSNKESIKNYTSADSIQNIEGKINLPFDVFKQYGFCEYHIYLQYIKNVKTQTGESHGRSIQHQLEDIFKQDADEITLKEALEISKTKPLMTRNCFLISDKYRIRGHVNEIWFKDDEIVLINDAQGRTPYDSTMNPIKAAGLVFGDEVSDKRKIKVALRERGSENLFWIEIITPEIKKDIESMVKRVHDLTDNHQDYIPTSDIKKCRKCEFKNLCKHSNVK